MASVEQVKPLQGVNLGGWLVLEPWLTPSLFKGSNAPDEFTFCSQLNDARLRRLRKHYREFITEKDFAWLAEHNIQAVRLPVGYGLFGDEQPYQKTIGYVDKAMQWAEKHDIKVLIDLHTAPGSQNGEMHSGRQGKIGWATPSNIAATLEVLKRIGERYGQHPALLGISFLNEPSPKIPRRQLELFYRKAYALLQPLCKPDCWLVFSDAFRPWRWYFRLPRRKYPNLCIDYHHYQLFSWLDKLLPIRWQLWRTKYTLPGKLRRMATRHPLIVGEWSVALHSEKLDKLDPVMRTAFTHDYSNAQLQAFQGCEAWFFWTYNAEVFNSWNYHQGVEDELIT